MYHRYGRIIPATAAGSPLDRMRQKIRTRAQSEAIIASLGGRVHLESLVLSAMSAGTRATIAGTPRAELQERRHAAAVRQLTRLLDS